VTSYEWWLILQPFAFLIAGIYCGGGFPTRRERLERKRQLEVFERMDRAAGLR
jgi:hypothetical protein